MLDPQGSLVGTSNSFNNSCWLFRQASHSLIICLEQINQVHEYLATRPFGAHLRSQVRPGYNPASQVRPGYNPTWKPLASLMILPASITEAHDHLSSLRPWPFLHDHPDGQVNRSHPRLTDPPMTSSHQVTRSTCEPFTSHALSGWDYSSKPSIALKYRRIGIPLDQGLHRWSSLLSHISSVQYLSTVKDNYRHLTFLTVHPRV